MLLQENEYSCGAYALANALEAVGADYAPGALARLCGTSPTNGTTEQAVVKTLMKLEHPVRELSESHAGFALVTLRGYVSQGAAALLACDADSHWISVIGMCGNRFIVHDPAAGTFSYSDKDLITRWRKEKTKMGFYGIVLLARR